MQSICVVWNAPCVERRISAVAEKEVTMNMVAAGRKRTGVTTLDGDVGCEVWDGTAVLTEVSG